MREPIWYTFVYAKCRRNDRITLWGSLIRFADDNSRPWIIGGDFNTVAHRDEKSSQHCADERAILEFNNFLMRAGLSDAGFSGNLD